MSFEVQEGAAPHPKGLLSPHLEGLWFFPQTFQFVLSVSVFLGGYSSKLLMERSRGTKVVSITPPARWGFFWCCF